MRPKEISIFKIHDTNSIKIMNDLILNFSHLNEHKSRHNFRATIDHMCSYGLEQEKHSLTSCIAIFTPTLE